MRRIEILWRELTIVVLNGQTIELDYCVLTSRFRVHLLLLLLLLPAPFYALLSDDESLLHFSRYSTIFGICAFFLVFFFP